MEKLTKKQRHKLYKQALINAVEQGIKNGLCYHLLDLQEVLTFYMSQDALDLFPEFALFEPKTELSGGYWFALDEQREIVLMFLIEMTR